MRRSRKTEKVLLLRFQESPQEWLRFRRVWADEYGNHFEDHPDWEEYEAFHLTLLKEDGYLEERYESNAGSAYLTMDDPCEYLLRLTPRGHDRLDRYSARYFFSNVAANIPTILVSVATALLIAWLIQSLGLNQ